MTETFESVYDEIGGFGRFQLASTLLLSLCQVTISWSMIQMSFGANQPDFQCIIPEWAYGNFGQSYHQDMYSLNQSTVLNNEQNYHNERYFNATQNACSINGTVCSDYRFDMHPRTVIKEWGLVCTLKSIAKVMISVQMAGQMLGGILAGQVSDVFGRRYSLYCCVLMHAITNLAATFSTCWEMFITLRFFIGIAIGGIVVITTPFQMEFLPIKWRPIVNPLAGYSWGVAVFALFAYIFEDWSILHLSLSVADFILLVGFFIIPESPRWLTTQGRIQEAQGILKRIARFNKKDISQESLSAVEVIYDQFKLKEKQRRYTYIDLFKDKFTAKMIVIFFFHWFVLSIVYYGIAFGVASLQGNVYLNIFLMGGLDVPFHVMSFFTNNKIGRRLSTSIFLGVCLVSLLTCLIAHETAPKSMEGILINVFSLIANMVNGAAWGCVHIWGMELFPTTTRNLGIGFSSLGARVGGILAPFIVDLEARMSVSYLILSISILLVIFTLFVVPEMNGKGLNDVVDERCELKGGSAVDMDLTVKLNPDNNIDKQEKQTKTI